MPPWDRSTTVPRAQVVAQPGLTVLSEGGEEAADWQAAAVPAAQAGVAEFLKSFMGFGNRRANFLGHGVGLQIDEPPVIAEGFDEPLAEGMTLALEPKKGIASVGMVGSENT